MPLRGAALRAPRFLDCLGKGDAPPVLPKVKCKIPAKRGAKIFSKNQAQICENYRNPTKLRSAFDIWWAALVFWRGWASAPKKTTMPSKCARPLCWLFLRKTQILHQPVGFVWISLMFCNASNGLASNTAAAAQLGQEMRGVKFFAISRSLPFENQTTKSNPNLAVFAALQLSNATFENWSTALMFSKGLRKSGRKPTHANQMGKVTWRPCLE